MEALLWGRVLERMLAVSLGGLSIWLGYRLFLKIPRQRSGEVRLALPGDISVYLTRVGPGVFFSLFGAAIVVMALRAGLMIESTLRQPTTTDAAPTAVRGAELTQRVGYAAAVLAPEDPQRLQARRAEARRTVAELNGLAALLAADTPPARRVDVSLALRDAKLALLQQVWGPDWGDFGQLAEWAAQAAAGAAPEGLHTDALALWRQPRP
jgi:hypothetical protein